MLSGEDRICRACTRDEEPTVSTGDKITGKAKEAAGKATGNKELETEGQTQNKKGHVKEKADNAGDTVRGAAKGLTGDDRR
jgi:uncharacterized protein YjbJ (UPF0337 family)